MIMVTILGILILISLSIFQLLLIFGKPLGNYAWGGQHTFLPKRLRIASIFSIVLYALFSISLASKADLVPIIPNGPFLTTVMWILTFYFALGVVMNAISRSKKERAVMTPVALLLAVIFLLVALN